MFFIISSSWCPFSSSIALTRRLTRPCIFFILYLSNCPDSCCFLLWLADRDPSYLHYYSFLHLPRTFFNKLRGISSSGEGERKKKKRDNWSPINSNLLLLTSSTVRINYTSLLDDHILGMHVPCLCSIRSGPTTISTSLRRS